MARQIVSAENNIIRVIPGENGQFSLIYETEPELTNASVLSLSVAYDSSVLTIEDANDQAPGIQIEDSFDFGRLPFADLEDGENVDNNESTNRVLNVAFNDPDFISGQVQEPGWPFRDDNGEIPDGQTFVDLGSVNFQSQPELENLQASNVNFVLTDNPLDDNERGEVLDSVLIQRGFDNEDGNPSQVVEGSIEGDIAPGEQLGLSLVYSTIDPELTNASVLSLSIAYDSSVLTIEDADPAPGIQIEDSFDFGRLPFADLEDGENVDNNDATDRVLNVAFNDPDFISGQVQEPGWPFRDDNDEIPDGQTFVDLGNVLFTLSPDFDPATDSTEVNLVLTDNPLPDNFRGEVLDIVQVPPDNAPPEFISDPVLEVEENSTAVPVQVDDPEGDSVTLTINGADQGFFTVDDQGNVSFTEAPNFENPESDDGDNDYEIELTADDGNGGTTTQNLQITVTDINEAPLAEDDPNATNEGEVLTVNAANGVLANDTDPDNANDPEDDPQDTLTVSAVEGGTIGEEFELASGALLTLNADGSYEYNPNGAFEELNDGQTDTDTFTYTVSDGNGGTDTATVEITINGETDNQPPEFDQTALTVGENETLVPVPVNDPDGDEVTLSVAGGADQDSFTIDAEGNLVFTEAPDFENPEDGNEDNVYEIELTADDGNGGTTTQNLQITVTDINEAPLAEDDANATNEGEVLTVDAANGVLANDTDPDNANDPEDDPQDTLTVSAVEGGTIGDEFDLASGALLTLNADGSYSYDPNGAFEALNDGETDTDTFTYTVSDGNGGTDTAEVTITINGETDNQPPVANDDTARTNEDTPLFVGNVTPPDGEPFQEVELALPTDEELVAGETFGVSLDYSTVPDLEDSPLLSLSIAYDSSLLSIQDVDDQTPGIQIEDPFTFGLLPFADLPDEQNIDNDDTTDRVLNIAFNDPEFLTGGPGEWPFRDDNNEIPEGQTFVELGEIQFLLSDTFDTAQDTTTIKAVITDNPLPGNDAETVVSELELPARESTIVGENLLANDEDENLDTLEINTVNGEAANVGEEITLAGPDGDASLTVNADGSYIFDPNEAFESLGAGGTEEVTFEYTLIDEGGLTSDPATVTITVEGVNDAPTAVDDPDATTDEGTVLNVDVADGVLANDTDPDDGDTLTVSAVNGDDANVGTEFELPSGALLTLNADGSYDYDPNGAFEELNDGQTDTDTFTYTVSDGNGGTDTAEVTVTIDGITDNLPPEFVAPDPFEFRVPEFVGTPTDGGNGASDAPVQIEINLLANENGTPGAELTPADIANGDSFFVEVVASADNPSGINSLSLELGFDSTVLSAVEEQFNDAANIIVDRFDFELGRVADLENGTITLAGGTIDANTDDDGDGVPDNVIGANGNPEQFALLQFEAIADPSDTVIDLEFPGVNDNGDPLGGSLGDGTPLSDVERNVQDFTFTDTEEGDGTFVGTVQAEDPDEGDTVTYSLTGDVDDGLFTINPETGELSFNEVPDFEDPQDADENNIYILEVTATDSEGATTVSDPLEVIVENVNEVPTAQDDTNSTDEDTVLTVEVAEGVLANDTDPDGDDLAVTAVNGDEANVDTEITLESGALLTLNADGSYSYDPNGAFEDLDDGDTDTDSFTYTVSDGNGGTDTAEVTVTIDGITDNLPPEFVPPFEFTVDEFVGTPTDGGNGASDAPVQIEINLLANENGTPGAELTPADIANGDSFFVEVVASAEDNPSGISSLSLELGFDSTVLSAVEEQFNDATNIIVDRFNFEPGRVADLENGTITLSGGTTDANADDDGDGVPDNVIGANGNPEQFALLQFEAIADPSDTVIDLEFPGVDENDNPLGGTLGDGTPLSDVERNVQDFTFTDTEEGDGTFVGTVQAEDPDEGDTVTYSLTGDVDDGLFTIDETTGELSFIDAPDFENPLDDDEDNVYEVQVTAEDENGAETPETLEITVNDVNEPPTFAQEVFNFDVDENSAAETLVGTVDVTDPEEEQLTLEIVDGNDDIDGDGEAAFVINDAGEITVNDSDDLDFETREEFTLAVTATDPQGLESTATVNIEVNDVRLTGDPDEQNVINFDPSERLVHTLDAQEGNNDETLIEVGLVLLDQGQNTEQALTAGKDVRTVFSVFPENFANGEPGTFVEALGQLERILSITETNRVGYVLNVGNDQTIDELVASTLDDELPDVLDFEEFSRGEVDDGFSLSSSGVTFEVSQPPDAQSRLGSNLQGQQNLEVFDLRQNVDGTQLTENDTVTAELTFDLISVAAFDNAIGFYTADENGNVTDEDGNFIEPGDEGYIDALLGSVITNGEGEEEEDIILTGGANVDKTEAGFEFSLQGGQIVVPFIIARGGNLEALPDSTDELPLRSEVYTPFIEANSDKADHFRLLGDNTFGIEDLRGGGDQDFNDIIFELNLEVA
jgi:VCBS repeat-containing protein